MTLFTIAAFLIALGVLFVIMGAERGPGRKIMPIPAERVQILALVFFVAGAATLAYAFYAGAHR